MNMLSAGPFSNDKGMMILYHQHSGCNHYGCWSQGLRRGKSSFLLFKITGEMSYHQTRWHQTFCHLHSFMRWPWVMKLGRHCYCPDLFLSASDIVRTGAQKNPRDKLSASDMRYIMSYDFSPLNVSPFRLSCKYLVVNINIYQLLLFPFLLATQ